MGFSTFIEINHDTAHKIAKDPATVGQFLELYTRACDQQIADKLESEFGIKVWKSASRSGWENHVRSVLNLEYRSPKRSASF